MLSENQLLPKLPNPQRRCALSHPEEAQENRSNELRSNKLARCQMKAKWITSSQGTMDHGPTAWQKGAVSWFLHRLCQVQIYHLEDTVPESGVAWRQVFMH